MGEVRKWINVAGALLVTVLVVLGCALGVVVAFRWMLWKLAERL